MTYESLTTIRHGDLLAEAAYQQLSEGILRNQLPPGTSLSVPELSRRLTISRSPVREAVQRLIYDGLADHRGRRGTVVSSIDVADFVSLLVVREVLEGLAARLAAEFATDDDLDQLQELNGAFLALRPDDHESESVFIELDMSFHRLIRETARNDELGTVLARTQARAHLSMHTLWTGARNVASAQSEHADICEAILSRDGEKADAVARRHIAALRSRVLNAVGNTSSPAVGTLRPVNEGDDGRLA